jgi:hypothetical protein
MSDDRPGKKITVQEGPPNKTKRFESIYPKVFVSPRSEPQPRAPLADREDSREDH